MKKLLLIFSGILLLAGCQKEQLEQMTPQEKAPPRMTTRSMAEGGMIVLGQKLENPYSVTNMQRAAEMLAKSRSTITPIDPNHIFPTHLYIKLHPKTHEELDLLKQDTTLILYEYPLDYEILQDGSYYHDPSIPDSLPTYQYTTIEFAFRLIDEIHGVEFEVLEPLFIPDEYKGDSDDVVIRGRAVNFENRKVEMLVDASFELCNLKLEDERPTGGIPGQGTGGIGLDGKWQPAGQIMYHSKTLGWIGLQGIKVRARRWFTTHTGIVNSSGNYVCDGRFKGPAHYSFDFERSEFEIRRTKLSKATYPGPKTIGFWNVNIDSSQEQAYFRATIFRAAYHYYYGNIGGLHRPPQNDFMRTQMKIRACYEESDDNGITNTAKRFLGLGSMIKIYNPERSDMDIYATTIHELAHAAHWRMIVDAPNSNRYEDYHYAEDKMTESWATGVQYYLTKMVYVTYQGRVPDEKYTNVVIDLMDTKVYDGINNGKSYDEGDKVDGYNMPQLESALLGCSTWIEWKNKIKTYDNATKQYVDELFAAW